MLVLDEPTNDLDAETLELLEDLLVEFGGTVLLVSHDRAFLNEVCTSLLAFEGEGRVVEYVGGYDDWQKERSRPQPAEGRGPARESRDAPASPAAGQPQKKARKLSNKERTELEALPKKIEGLEAEQAQLTASLADPAFFKKGGAEVPPPPRGCRKSRRRWRRRMRGGRSWREGEAMKVERVVLNALRSDRLYVSAWASGSTCSVLLQPCVSTSHTSDASAAAPRASSRGFTLSSESIVVWW